MWHIEKRYRRKRRSPLVGDKLKKIDMLDEVGFESFGILNIGIIQNHPRSFAEKVAGPFGKRVSRKQRTDRKL